MALAMVLAHCDAMIALQTNSRLYFLHASSGSVALRERPGSTAP